MPPRSYGVILPLGRGPAPSHAGRLTFERPRPSRAPVPVSRTPVSTEAAGAGSPPQVGPAPRRPPQAPAPHRVQGAALALGTGQPCASSTSAPRAPLLGPPSHRCFRSRAGGAGRACSRQPARASPGPCRACGFSPRHSKIIPPIWRVWGVFGCFGQRWVVANGSKGLLRSKTGNKRARKGASLHLSRESSGHKPGVQMRQHNAASAAGGTRQI